MHSKPIYEYMGIILILRPTFCRHVFKIQPGKYLPGRLLCQSLQNVGHNTHIYRYFSTNVHKYGSLGIS